MGRAIKDIVCRPCFDDDAGIHDVNAAAHLGDDAEIMGDEDDGHTQFGLEELEDIQDLGFGRHVEGRCRFVRQGSRGEQDGAMAMDSAGACRPDNSWGYWWSRFSGDVRPTALSSSRALAWLGLAPQVLVQGNALAELVPDGQDGIERRRRSWKIMAKVLKR